MNNWDDPKQGAWGRKKRCLLARGWWTRCRTTQTRDQARVQVIPRVGGTGESIRRWQDWRRVEKAWVAWEKRRRGADMTWICGREEQNKEGKAWEDSPVTNYVVWRGLSEQLLMTQWDFRLGTTGGWGIRMQMGTNSTESVCPRCI
jgi:hypothetical protein